MENQFDNIEISVDDSGNVDPISMEYNEYRSDLNAIYRATSSNNSIVSKFIIDNDKCRHELKIKYDNGQESLEKQEEFDYKNEFVDTFLIPMIEDYNKYNHITSRNIILNKDGKTTRFVAHTSDNDLLEIDNIDLNTSNKFIELLKAKNAVNTDNNIEKINQKGISNALTIILTMVMIGITFIGTIFFTIMANK